MHKNAWQQKGNVHMGRSCAEAGLWPVIAAESSYYYEISKRHDPRIFQKSVNLLKEWENSV